MNLTTFFFFLVTPGHHNDGLIIHNSKLVTPLSVNKIQPSSVPTSRTLYREKIEKSTTRFKLNIDRRHKFEQGHRKKLFEITKKVIGMHLTVIKFNQSINPGP